MYVYIVDKVLKGKEGSGYDLWEVHMCLYVSRNVK
jgi:hypothetical protein